MPNLNKICRQCRGDFEVTDEDLKFYEKISPIFNGKKYLVPAPTFCPDCRMQRRMSFRCERKLYKRSCDLCKKEILAMYRSELPFPVYCPNCFWSDKWDPLQYGKDFDFSKSFFEQFEDLSNQVPHFSLAVLSTTMENSDYCNHAGYLKNCYLIFNSDESEQCLYGKCMNRCFDCMDCFKIYDCEGCYESSNCTNCSFCSFLIDSHTSDDCHFSANLIGCKNCFGCVNLRNQQYSFFNEKLSKEEYLKKVAEIKNLSSTMIGDQKTNEEIFAEFLDFRKKYFMKWMQEKNTENCTGDYLVQSKDCFNCFDCEYLEKSKYCCDLKKGGKVSFENYDISYFGMGIDASYECSVGGYNANHILFCENVWESYDCYYCQICPQGCHDLFGCVGMRHKEYCILNKQYTKEEYEILVPKIINHMIKTGEFGEFFPSSMSPFAYNETNAQEYFPLTKEEAISKNYKWLDEKDIVKCEKEIFAHLLPKNIEDIPDDILNWAIICEKSGRPFKIVKSELNFYRKYKLGVPRLHPDERHKKRLDLRNPRELWQRKCDKCEKGILTTYAPDREEKVYCEECYLEGMY